MSNEFLSVGDREKRFQFKSMEFLELSDKERYKVEGTQCVLFVELEAKGAVNPIVIANTHLKAGGAEFESVSIQSLLNLHV